MSREVHRRAHRPHARRLQDDLDKLADSRGSIDGLVARPGLKSSPRAATSCRRALEDDLDKLSEARSNIDSIVAGGQVEKLAEGRDILTRALELDLHQNHTSGRAGTCQTLIDQQVEQIRRRSGHAGARPSEEDVQKLARESRSSIDGLVSVQVEKLAKGPRYPHARA